MSAKKTKLALLHRYGLEGWLCCGGHAVPEIVAQLSSNSEVHFFGPSTTEPKRAEIRNHLTMHTLPWLFDRANPKDKWSKTIRFYLALPGIARKCKKQGIDFIYWEETLPLGTTILQLFYGPNLGVMVMDFFVRIYTENKPWLHWLRNLVEWIDLQSWKKVPVIFTHVNFAKQFLVERGVPPERIHVVPNPVDHTIFHPVDEATRKATRHKLGFTDQDIVLSHHGILHPNKGNDWILHRIAELKEELPDLKYLLIGNGSEMDPLITLADNLKIADRVTFTGWLPSEADLNNALASSDIGLVMRIGQETDHFHMTDTLNHEMACEKPILAVDLKGIAEFIVDGENGFLFSLKDSGDFDRKLKLLYSQSEIRQEFGKKIKEVSLQLCSISQYGETLVRSFRANRSEAYRG